MTWTISTMAKLTTTRSKISSLPRSRSDPDLPLDISKLYC